ncbi:uncharacterized protein LOC141648740 [Silene latifolia]|uniref:uncharacterized protein LOC141648740 n=1 Tax=Silene latifolia TaxID=37657 RepID=UPI003D779A25
MHNTRISNLNLEPFDPEIDYTLFRLRKNKRGAIVAVPEGSEFDDLHSDSEYSEISEQPEPLNMARETRTLRELTALNLNVQPLCITFPALDDGVTFELKSGLIHQLPSLSGMSIEDPNKHLSDFHIVCTGMKPPAITDEQLKLRAFPFTLKDNARDWLNYLPPGSITTWVGISQLKRAISNVKQQDGKTMYEYLEKFKKLCASCPYHSYSDQDDLIMYFCGGLNQDDRRMIHSACGGNIANKNPDEAWEVISELAETSRQFERKPSRRGVNAMGVNPGLEEKVDNIVSTLPDMLSGRQMATVFGICATEGHPNDLCPYLRESGQEEVNGVWESTINTRKWNPYSKTYNKGWKAHPNFRWGNSQAGPSSGPPRGQFLQRPQGQQFNQQVPQQAAEQAPPSSSMSTEYMIRALTLSVTQDRADNKQNFKSLENQVSKLATAINRLEARDSNALPFQTVVNPRENVSDISLRNGRQLVEIEKPKAKPKVVTIHEKEEEIVIEEDEKASNVKEKEQIPSSIPKEEPEVPFPDALKRIHHFEHDKDIYEVVSVVVIGDLKFEKAMLDLGASINVIPFAIYETLKLGPLKDTSVVVQLADRSSVYPKGIVENVMVGVGKLAFPADFYVMDMKNEAGAIPVLLGRPFLRTAGTKIDVPKGSLTMEFDGTGSPHKEQRCVILWDCRDDAEAFRGKNEAWFDKLIRRKGSGKGLQTIHIKSHHHSSSCKPVGKLRGVLCSYSLDKGSVGVAVVLLKLPVLWSCCCFVVVVVIGYCCVVVR